MRLQSGVAVVSGSRLIILFARHANSLHAFENLSCFGCLALHDVLVAGGVPPFYMHALHS
jgi:hypothetical protein